MTYERRKLLDEVVIPEHLNFSKLFPKSLLKSQDYHLYGKVIHAGPSAQYGHYYCVMRENIETDEWYVFNDRDVKSEQEENYLNQ